VGKNPDSDEKLKSADQAWFDSDLSDNVMAINDGYQRD